MRTAGGHAKLLLKYFESLRLKAYPDPGSRDGTPWTIGWGHTRGVKPGDVCTKEEADAWLVEDMKTAERAVNKYVKVELNQYQFDALVSFTYNLGEGALKKSTLLRLVNQKKFEEAAQQFLRWVFNDGAIMKGLVKRRKMERDLFLKEKSK